MKGNHKRALVRLREGELTKAAKEQLTDQTNHTNYFILNPPILISCINSQHAHKQGNRN